MGIRNTINWGALRDRFRRKAADGAREAAEYLAERARVYCPVDTGALKASIVIIKASGSNTYHVVATMPYARFVELGYHHHVSGTWIPPNPFMRRALADARARYASAAGARFRVPGASDVSHLGVSISD